MIQTMWLSLLVSSRKNSKFLSKLIFSYLTKTKNLDQTEMLIMVNSEDTWNADLLKTITAIYPNIHVFYENYGMGRNGLHRYFNELAGHAKGDWFFYLCDDHDIVMKDYDHFIKSLIDLHQMNPHKIYQIIPRCSNSGSISHILSRGWYDILGDLGKHGNIDSYINYVSFWIQEHRIFRPDEYVVVDYTADPSVMSPEHTKAWINPEFSYPYGASDEVQALAKIDGEKLHIAIDQGL